MPLALVCCLRKCQIPWGREFYGATEFVIFPWLAHRSPTRRIDMSRHRHPHRQRARDLRNHPTEAEYKLWGYLRARQFGNVKFRRQAPIGNYIVDFVSYERRLIIELDGEQHAEQQVYDAQRTEWLESQGFTVVRFWNADVFENIDGVLTVLASRLGLPD